MNRPASLATLAALSLAALAGCAGASEPPAASPSSVGPSTGVPSSTTGTTVVRVVDGDTVVVARTGANVTVRIVGIDTPETVKPGSPVGKCGPEASQATKDMLPAGKPVNLVPDPTQDATDKYGRDLAYVEVDGKDVGFELVINGLALPYKYRNPAPQRYATYVAAEGVAQAHKLGLFGTSCKTT